MGKIEELNQDLYIKMQGQGSPILAIHGIISDSTFFDKAAMYLSECYEIITYDRRGYGKSNQSDFLNYSVHAQAMDAAKILWENCSEPAWIVGNSAGGLIAIELALYYPELVKGMILIEPSLGYDEIERGKLLAWNQELNGYVKENKIKKALPAFSRITGGPKSTAKSVSLAELKMTYHNLSTFMYGELNEVQNYLPPIEKLREFSMPVVVGVTEEGKESIFATSSKNGAEMLGWPVVLFPGYHNVAKEMPEEFAQKIKEIIFEYDKDSNNMEK